jgi:thiamine biosynthesis protein ThiI
MDKQEIIDQARKIGTFDTSAIPDQDCCQLFVPQHPATKAKLGDVEKAESSLDVSGLTQLGVDGAKAEEFRFPS